jgi:capsular exopolysaccharide synthesis family protein
MPNHNNADLRGIFSVMRRWLWVILGCTVVGGMVAFFVTGWLPPIYQASTTLLVEPSQDTNLSDYSALMAGERLALTYSQMLKGALILEKVITQLDIDETVEDLSEKIVVEPVANTQLMRLTVSESSPEKAALLANTMAEIFTTHVRALQADRYADLLQSLRDQMNAASAQMDETESTMDSLSARKIDNEAKLARVQSLLVELRADLQTLQQNQQELQITKEEAANSVKIVEPAQMPTQPERFPYVATVTLLVDQVPETSGGDYAAILASERLAQTYGEILAGRQVLEAALSKVESDESPDALARRVNVEPVTGTQLIRLRVEDTDADQAKLLADAIAGAFLDQVQVLLTEPYATRLQALQTQMDDLSGEIEATQAEIESLSAEKVQAETELVRLDNQLIEDRNDYRALKQDYEQLKLTANDASQAVSIVEPAQLPEHPEENRGLYIALAALTCAVVTIGIAFLREYLDDTIRTPEDVNLMGGTSPLAIIGEIPQGEDELVVLAQPRSPITEAFRMLAANIRFSSLDRPVRTLLVTSPSSQEGKSIVLANLAAAMAGSGQRIVVVDADLRLPRLQQVFKLDNGAGLTDSLIHSSLDGNLQATKMDGLKVVTSGKLPANPVEVVGSARMREFLEQLEAKTDVVIIDSPPVLPVADAAILTSLADGVILVLRAGQTRQRDAQQAVKNLKQAGAQLIGIVLNAVPHKSAGYNSYYRYEREDKTSSSPTWRESPDGATKIGSPTLSRMKSPLASVRKLFDRQKEA